MEKQKGNRLLQETSPYLQQHAYNPVNWYPWGNEALDLALRENKPILVSIGYSACHWCHVMERESFEDEATATFMNEHFVNIKIDREERPDLDHIYMDAVQAMTGSGGWPLNVFLTPDKKPFYGGTYFPPKRMHNRSSWMEVLDGVRKAFQERKSAVEEQANNLIGHLNKSNAFGLVQPEADSLEQFYSKDTLNKIAGQILEQADTTEGGFGNAPKFPQTFSIVYLLRHHHFTGDAAALQQALLSLDKMIQGGIYDQLGGGFARYSTDAQWQVPHFEKMLYDNALLLIAISEAYQLTGNPHYQHVIQQTMDFISREMTNESHGFYSALDADSEGVEGKFYTWTKAELDAALQEDAPFFNEFYRVEANGNWHEGKQENPPTNILWTNRNPEPEIMERLQRCREKLMQLRAKRVRPLLDDKVLLGWNAMMITACCKAGAATGTESYLRMATESMLFLENQLRDAQTGLWNHTYKAEQPRIPAFLDDYAALIQAYIHLQEMTGEAAYLHKAEAMTHLVLKHFEEPESGFFFYTPDFQQDLIMRKKEVYDGATPSGNAIMAENLQYLAIVFDRPEWAERARKMLASLQNAIQKHPTSFGVWAAVFQKEVIGFKEIVVTGQQAVRYLYPINRKYIPNKIIQAAETNPGNFPLLNGKQFGEDGVLFYLCSNYTCGPAFNTVEAFLAKV
ncbi:MAG: thioredoxin domain-containing protein [Sediminibacterium sp.]|nr:thioredoxin domain-containing protein [Sediminibacterium sp.]